MEQNFCLSLRPSDTETFYQFLEANQLPYLKSVERDYNLPRFKERFLAPHDEPYFYIINFLDEKLHSDKGSLIDLLTEFMERLKAFLFPILSQLKQDDVFYLSSDHGFVERTGYQYKDTARYGHGGDGVWERVVGVGKFKKIWLKYNMVELELKGKYVELWSTGVLDYWKKSINPKLHYSIFL